MPRPWVSSGGCLVPVRERGASCGGRRQTTSDFEHELSTRRPIGPKFTGCCTPASLKCATSLITTPRPVEGPARRGDLSRLGSLPL
jgi:hypothetical protein